MAGVYKAPYIYAIIHKQGRATPTSTMDIPIKDTHFINTLYNAHSDRRHRLDLATLLQKLRNPSCIKMQTGYSTNHTPITVRFLDAR